MTRQEILKKIDSIDDYLWYLEMADLNYEFDTVARLKKERKRLEMLLEEC